MLAAIGCQQAHAKVAAVAVIPAALVAQQCLQAKLLPVLLLAQLVLRKQHRRHQPLLLLQRQRPSNLLLRRPLRQFPLQQPLHMGMAALVLAMVSLLGPRPRPTPKDRRLYTATKYGLLPNGHTTMCLVEAAVFGNLKVHARPIQQLPPTLVSFYIFYLIEIDF